MRIDRLSIKGNEPKDRALKSFREQAQKFQVFHNVEETTSSIETNIFGLEDYIVEKDLKKSEHIYGRVLPITEKSQRYIISINPFRCGKKRQRYALVPNNIMLDIDVKTDEQKAWLCKDMGEKDPIKAIEKAYNLIKNDPATMYVDYSHSGLGFKAIFPIISNNYSKYADEIEYKYSFGDLCNSENSDEDNQIINKIHRENYDVLYKYLNTYYNFTYRGLDKEDYYDNATKTVQQCIYSSWGKECHINPYCDFITYQTNSKITNKSSKTHTNTSSNSLSAERAKNINNIFMNDLRETFTNPELKGTKIFDEALALFNKNAEQLFSHYNFAFLNSCRMLSDINLELIYIHFLQYADASSSIRKELDSFDRFKSFINNKYERYNEFVPISSFFDSDFKLTKTKDLYNNEFDEIIKYEKYLSSDEDVELKHRIFDLYDNNNYLVINSDAGSGKSTVSMEYACKKIAEGEMERIMFIIPKNMLLQQQLHKFHQHIDKKIAEGNHNYTKIELHKNYGTNRCDGTEKGIIFSSTVKSETFKEKVFGFELSEDSLVFDGDDKIEQDNNFKNIDLIFVDEFQNLVNFSNEIKSNLNRNFDNTKKILFSATPESYLIMEKGYKYIRFEKKDSKKRILIKHVSKQHRAILKRIISKDRKQLIFYNHKEKSRDMFTKENFPGIDFLFLNASVESIEKENIINNELLPNKHVVATSIISDGINFENKEWDDLIIIEHGSLSAQEIYQLSNRFRSIDDLTIRLISNPRPFKYSYFKWNLDEEDYNRRIAHSLGFEKKLDESHIINNNMSLTTSDRFVKVSEKKFKFNIESIKKEYNDEYMRDYLTCQDLFENALKYYFVVYNIYNLEKVKSEMVRDDKPKELFNTYTKEITEIFYNEFFMNGIKKNNIKEKMGVDDNTWKDIIKHYNTLFTYSERYYELKHLGENTSYATLPSTIYNGHIKRWKEKYIGGKETDEGLDKMDVVYREYQEKFCDYIKENCMTTFVNRNGKFDGVLVSDIISHFAENKEKYDKFIREDNNTQHYFELEKKELGSYMSKITRNLYKTKKNIDGKQKQIYMFKNKNK